MGFHYQEMEGELRALLQADPWWIATCKEWGLTSQEIDCVRGFRDSEGLIDRHMGSYLLSQYKNQGLRRAA